LLSTLVQEERILKTLTDKGIYRQTDYLSFRIEMMNLERNVHDLDLGFRKELWNLNMICGITDTSSCELKLPAIRDTLSSSPEHSLFFQEVPDRQPADHQ